MRIIAWRDNGFIKPIRMLGLNCLEACLISILRHQRRPYELIFYKAFDFETNLTEDLAIGPNVSVGTEYIAKYCKEFFQLYIDDKHPQYSTPYKLIQTNALKCMWLNHNQQMDVIHFILLLQNCQGEYICIDPTYIDDLLVFNHRELAFLCEKQLDVIQEPSKKSDIEVLRQSIALFHKHVSSLKIRECFELFIRRIQQSTSLEYEFSDCIPPLQKLEYLFSYMFPGTRKMLLLYLQKVHQYVRFEQYPSITDLIQRSIIVWEHLKMNLLKIKYTHNFIPYKEFFLNKLELIMSYESNIYRLLSVELKNLPQI